MINLKKQIFLSFQISFSCKGQFVCLEKKAGSDNQKTME